ncbi:MAG: hypothetical protein LBK68_06080 [Candidatus Margulisbacteria bacterium]|jgi:hypothetical protein|nr:hypothetical protein [Candidatus Margulisiibacteriota bacterium]
MRFWNTNLVGGAATSTTYYYVSNEGQQQKIEGTSDINDKDYHDEYDVSGKQVTGKQLFDENKSALLDIFVKQMATKDPPDIAGLATLYNNAQSLQPPAGKSVLNALFNSQVSNPEVYNKRGIVTYELIKQMVTKSPPDIERLTALCEHLDLKGYTEEGGTLESLYNDWGLIENSVPKSSFDQLIQNVKSTLQNVAGVSDDLKAFLNLSEGGATTSQAPNDSSKSGEVNSGFVANGISQNIVAGLSQENNGVSGIDLKKYMSAEEVLEANTALRASRTSGMSNDVFENQYGMSRSNAENIIENIIKESAQQNRLDNLFFDLRSENGSPETLNNARTVLMNTMLRMYGGSSREAKIVTSFIDKYLTELIVPTDEISTENAKLVFDIIRGTGKEPNFSNLANITKHLLNGSTNDKLLLTSLMLYRDEKGAYPFQQTLRYLIFNKDVAGIGGPHLTRSICDFTENIKIPADMDNKEGNIAMLVSLKTEFANGAALVKYDHDFDGKISHAEMHGGINIGTDSNGQPKYSFAMNPQDAMLFYSELVNRGTHFAYGAESRLSSDAEDPNKPNASLSSDPNKALKQVMDHLIGQNSNIKFGAGISMLLFGGYVGGVAALAGICPPLAVLLGVVTAESIGGVAAAGGDAVSNAQARLMFANSLPVIQRIFQDGGLLSFSQNELNKFMEGLSEIYIQNDEQKEMVEELLRAIRIGIENMDNGEDKNRCKDRMTRAITALERKGLKAEYEKNNKGEDILDKPINNFAKFRNLFRNEVTGAKLDFEEISKQNENKIDFTNLLVDTTPRNPEEAYKPKADDVDMKGIQLPDGTTVDISGYIKDPQVRRILERTSSPMGLDTKPAGIIRGSDFAALSENDRLSLIRDIFNANSVPALSVDQKLEVLLDLVEKWGGEDSPGGKALLDTLFKYCYNGDNNSTNGHPTMSPAFTSAINNKLNANKGGALTRYLENPSNYSVLRKVVRHCLDADDEEKNNRNHGLTQSRQVLKTLLGSSEIALVKNTLFIIQEAFDATGGAIWDSDVRWALTGSKNGRPTAPLFNEGDLALTCVIGNDGATVITVKDALEGILTKGQNLKLERVLPPSTNAASNDRFADAQRRIATAKNVLLSEQYRECIDASFSSLSSLDINKDTFVRVISENCPFIDLRSLSENQVKEFIKAFADNMKLAREIDPTSSDEEKAYKKKTLIEQTQEMFTKVGMGEVFAKAYSSEHYVLGIYDKDKSYKESSRAEQVNRNGGDNTRALSYQYIAPGSDSGAVASFRNSTFNSGGGGISRNGNTPYEMALADKDTKIHRGPEGEIYFVVKIGGKEIKIQPQKFTKDGPKGIELDHVSEENLKDALLAELRKENSVGFELTEYPPPAQAPSPPEQP